MSGAEGPLDRALLELAGHGPPWMTISVPGSGTHTHHFGFQRSGVDVGFEVDPSRPAIEVKVAMVTQPGTGVACFVLGPEEQDALIRIGHTSEPEDNLQLEAGDWTMLVRGGQGAGLELEVRLGDQVTRVAIEGRHREQLWSMVNHCDRLRSGALGRR